MNDSNKKIRYIVSAFIIFIMIAVVSSFLIEKNDLVQVEEKNIEDVDISSDASSSELPEVGYKAPNFSLNDMNGKRVSLSDYKGKVVFLNIWATWCPPCIAEMPSIEKMYNRFKSDRFEVMAVSVDSKGFDVVFPFVKNAGMSFPVLLDPEDTVTRLYNINSIPQTIIIGADGIIILKIAGARDWSSEKSFEAIEFILSKKV